MFVLPHPQITLTEPCAIEFIIQFVYNICIHSDSVNGSSHQNIDSV